VKSGKKQGKIIRIGPDDEIVLDGNLGVSFIEHKFI
jgi:hypothetical protein